jgi:hypothetical protein
MNIKMKKVMPILALGFCSSLVANEIDYSHCQDKASGAFFSGYNQQHPFTIESDGKIKPHASVGSYQFDKKNNSDVLKISRKEFGIDSETQIIVKRDENGQISQIVHQHETKVPSMRTGMGSNIPQPIGLGVFGMPGMMGGMGNMSTTTVTDVKIENGKCFPYRSYIDTKNGNNEHRSLLEEAQLCRDITSKLQEEQKENSKLAELKSCHDQYQNEANRIISDHKERNADLYDLSEEEAAKAFGGGMGGYGFGMGYGGFGMSIDNIVNSQQFSAGEKLKMLTVYCMYPGSPLAKISSDDQIFATEPLKPMNPGISNEGFGISR